MNIRVQPGRLCGTLAVIPSKSVAHRLLIAAALCDAPTRIACAGTSRDIEATARCLTALCADIGQDEAGFDVRPLGVIQGGQLFCGESGSTWRFLLPVACALGANSTFHLEGRLPQRPMDALYQALEGQGIRMVDKGTPSVQALGLLRGGVFTLPGDVSSQFISGLLLAAPLTGVDCTIVVEGPLASRPYVDITLQALQLFGVQAHWQGNSLLVPGGQRYVSPGPLSVEGDWSNAALLLCGAAAGRGDLTLTGLPAGSAQGDRVIVDMLRRFGARVQQGADSVHVQGGPLHAATVDINDCPDLAPAIALLAAAAEGRSQLSGISRLRIKESDRVRSILHTLNTLGVSAHAEDDSLFITGGPVTGGVCPGWDDHRIVMLAALLGGQAAGDITILGAQAVHKSYPRFFEDMAGLGIVVQPAEG